MRQKIIRNKFWNFNIRAIEKEFIKGSIFYCVEDVMNILNSEVDVTQIDTFDYKWFDINNDEYIILKFTNRLVVESIVLFSPWSNENAANWLLNDVL